MPFRYRLQKILDLRIMKKEEQELAVVRARQEVARVENLIDQNNQEITSTRENMRKADYTMYEAYDTYLKHLYDKGVELEQEKQVALDKLEEEKQKLFEMEKEVNVLEKHKERLREIYLEEEKKAELKQLSEIGSQRFFLRTREEKEEAEMLRKMAQEAGIEVSDED
ncbi:hypothetical protein IJS77_04270 [bacterium]|nr:hypothetical protein [bacterium]